MAERRRRRLCARGRKADRRLLIEQLERRLPLAAQPIINEVLAGNDGVIQDVDGDYSDFIEIYNAGDATINLAGWRLTDEDDDLEKWTFPSVNLGVGQYLVVFASGKDRALAGGQLHTNFALAADGEYLALVRPDDSIASEFAPTFPPQTDDVSYGVGSDLSELTLIGPMGPVQALVPPNGTLGTSWTLPGFTPTGWANGSLGVGYSGQTSGPPSTTVLQVDFNDRAGAANTLAGFSSFIIGGSDGVIQTAPTTRTFGAYSVTVTDVSGLGYDDRLRVAPTNNGAFTEALLLQDFFFSRDQGGESGFDVTVAGLTPGAQYTLSAWSFDVLSTGQRTSDWTANGISVANYSFDGSATPTSNTTYRMGFVVTANASGQIVLSGRNDESMADFGVFLNALRVETGDTINGPGETAIRVDFNDRTVSDAVNTESGYATMTLDENGATIGGATITFSAFGGAVLDDRDRTAPVDGGAFTLDQVYDDFILTTGAAGTGMEILIQGLAPNATYELALRSLDGNTTSSGTRQATWTEVSGGSPVTIAAPYSYTAGSQPTSNDANTMRAELTTSALGTLVLRGVQIGASSSVVVNALELTRAGFDEQVNLDVEASMEGVNSSIYIRAPFSVPNPAVVGQLFVDVMYDAGFVAYLNGQEVARQNAPTAVGVPPTFNAAATLERGNSEALQPTTLDLTSFKHLLVAGSGNVLAFHGLNSAAGDDDFLIAPVLRGIEAGGQSLRYFETPTPGAANGEGVLGFVEQVTLSAAHGFYDAPFVLTLSSPTAGAAMYYTLNGSIPGPGNPASVLYAAPFAVNRTTVVRAGAVLEDYADAPIATATYIFLDDVVNQTINTSNPASNPFGLAYPGFWQTTYSGDYNMDSRVTSQWDDDNPSNTDFGIREALQSIPTMSIVMDHNDLWNTSTGIYPNAISQGDSWRRAGSIEYVDPNTGEQFQYNVGVQMHGAASRDNLRTKKHSFRLVFNNEFDGPGRLNFPLFDDSTFTDINTVVLKASFTDSFPTRTQTGRYSPIGSTYLRDVWTLDSQRDMGSLSSENTYVHLYINGLYWGLYYPAERIDDAYLSSRLGGAEEDWDVIKDFNETFRGNNVAWNAMFALVNQMPGASATTANSLYQQLQGRNPDGTANPALPAYLDTDNFIDYILMHVYGGVEDWPSHNWIAARNRVNPGTGFRFYTWDQEIALDGRFRDRTEVGAGGADTFTPGELFDHLQNSSEFRLRFADRVQKHLFNDGALTVAAATARWQENADQIEAAIIGESARWGDAREGENVNVPPQQIIPLMTVNHWRGAVADVVTYIPQHHSLALSRLQTDGLVATLAAPVLSQFGGATTPGYGLTMTSPGGGTIYYTTNGQDPRQVGGAINSPSAAAYAGAVTINATTTVRARTLVGSTWSALTEATFVVSQGTGGIVISELNYHPHGPTAGESSAVPGVNEDDFDFIEVLNTHPTNSISLLNMALANGLTFTFPNVNLAAGQRAVVVENVAAFQARYGTGHTILGSWNGNAANSGETIELRNSIGGVIMALTYADLDPWSEAADGDGATLEMIDPFNTPADRLAKWYSWRASTQYGGSPSTAGTAPLGVVVNEVRSRASAGQTDAIELFNTTTGPINIGGWWLSDAGGTPLKYQIPADTVLPAGTTIVFDEDDFNPASPAPGQIPFALDGREGDDVFLTVGNGSGVVTSIVDSVHFGPSLAGETFSRLPNGAGRLAPTLGTLGAANVAVRSGPLVISEIGYRPGAPSSAALALDPSITSAQLEFVEIYNRSGGSVDLLNYRLAGGPTFEFPAGTLAAAQAAVLVPFNPALPANAARTAAFRAHYGISAGVTLLGPFAGGLSDDGARVELLSPDDPLPENPLIIPRVTSDEALYDNLAPWPSLVATPAVSLHRQSAASFGNAAASWAAAAPSPGTVPFGSGLTGDFDADFDVDGHDFLAWQRGIGTPNATPAHGDADGDDDVDGLDLGLWGFHFGETAPEPAMASVAIATADAAPGASLAAGDAAALASYAASRHSASPVRWTWRPQVRGDELTPIRHAVDGQSFDAALAAPEVEGDAAPVGQSDGELADGEFESVLDAALAAW